MAKTCAFCGKVFETVYPRQICCSEECSRERHREQIRERDKVNNSKRKKKRKVDAQNKNKKRDIVAIGYAERQIANTLASVPKINPTLEGCFHDR